MDIDERTPHHPPTIKPLHDTYSRLLATSSTLRRLMDPGLPNGCELGGEFGVAASLRRRRVDPPRYQGKPKWLGGGRQIMGSPGVEIFKSASACKNFNPSCGA
ncbi:hypothetical protein J6590_076713 [Homalodisca vitripennis]|nr:hypothetical protein J6590_076713 [Homalodisca vitripennis]